MSQNDLLKVRIEPELPRPEGRAHYRRDEYGLIYAGILNRVAPSKLSDAIDAKLRIGVARKRFVTTGFLTLTFDEPGGILSTIDAYTNSNLWTAASGEEMLISGSGGLVLDESWLDDEDRRTLSGDPRYSFDAKAGTLHITLTAPSTTSRCFEIGENLRARISGAHLEELTLLNVLLE